MFFFYFEFSSFIFIFILLSFFGAGVQRQRGEDVESIDLLYNIVLLLAANSHRRHMCCFLFCLFLFCLFLSFFLVLLAAILAAIIVRTGNLSFFSFLLLLL